jgi:hypothetical protein
MAHMVMVMPVTLQQQLRKMQDMTAAAVLLLQQAGLAAAARRELTAGKVQKQGRSSSKRSRPKTIQ